MGTEGMRASLVSREVIADSIELVARGHLLRRARLPRRLRQDDPGRRDGLCRLDMPGLVLYSGSIAPGRFRGRDVTIQDVFEAIGAHAAGHDERGRRCTSSSRSPAPAPARAAASSRRTRCRRRSSSSASRPAGLNGIPALDTAKDGGGRTRPARSRCELVRDDVRPSHDRHARRARERGRVGRRHGRLDERRAAPDRDREASSGSSSRCDDFDEIARADAGRHGDQAGRPVRRDRRPRARAASRSSRASSRSASSSTRARATVDGRTLGEVADDAVRDAGPAGRRPDRAAAEGDRRAARALGQPRAGGLRRQARRPRPDASTAARRACSTRRRSASRRSRRSAIRPGDVVVIRYEGPAGGPGMREMLHVTAAIVGEGLGDDGRARHRRPLLGRDARVHGRPRRARGVPRRPDRGAPRRRHGRGRRRGAGAARRALRRRARGAAARLDAAGAALPDGRAREVRGARVVGERGRGHAAAGGVATARHPRARRGRRAGPPARPASQIRRRRARRRSR